MYIRFSFVLGLCFLFLISGVVADAATLASRVPEAFKSVYGRTPTAAESKLWTDRVNKGDKKTYEALVGAMSYQKANVGKTPAVAKVSSKDQMIIDVLPLFITTFGNDPSNTEKAWWRKRISCGEIKNTTQLISSMNFHKSKKVRKGSEAICGIKPTASTSTSSGGMSGVLRRAVAGVTNHPSGDDIRVGIFSTPLSAIEITVDNGFQIREGKNKILAKLGKDDVIKVSWSGGKYHVRGSGIEEDTTEIIRIVPLNQGIVKLINYSDPSATYPGKNYNQFRGVMEIRKCTGCNELWAINELRMEYYLRGLGETSGQGPEEYIKALGIAARTYATYHKVVTGGRNVQKGYDLTNTPNDQIYRGYGYEAITPRMSSIFNKVKGIIVTNGEGDVPVSTVYFSDSDGRTRSAKEAWGTNRFPHLQKSVKDPHHASNSCKGHCVGMSAQGAYGFANKDGWSFQKILNYYYQGIKLVKAY